ncbi:seven in absentia protein family domain-containing protein [Ditylenchus destructor]|uniref:E3 ubiquitin-protein ligase n=1 Tax=Ditylenchus destructor TaxID=166010 RepID=A0AAD4NEM5_9BILA|nr:seven in absentia protein family domain-containing protein [Ditylenchus destructor]
MMNNTPPNMHTKDMPSVSTAGMGQKSPPHSSNSNQTGVATPNQKTTTARIQATATPATMLVSGQQVGIALPGQQHSVAPQLALAPGSSTQALLPALAGPTTTELLSAFECPVCLEHMLPPYLQCPSGHLVCGNCRPKVTCCPTCRGAVPSIRNLGMEKIANTMLFPCKFSHSGCTQHFLHNDKVEHEETCEYRPYSCPCPGSTCKWLGNLSDVMGHLMKMHKSITTLQGEDIVFLATDINLPGAVDWVMMQACFGSYFMLVLEKQDKQEQSGQSYQMFYAVVQLIGTKKEAENFMYRLELSNHRRRLCWEATPRSIHEGIAAAISQSDCLSFDTNHAQLFAESGNLGINVTIQNLNQ